MNPAALASARSALVSLAFGLWTALLTEAGTAFAEGSLATPHLAWTWLVAHWWGILIGFMVGASTSSAYRANQGYRAATSVVSTPTYTSVPTQLTSSPKGP